MNIRGLLFFIVGLMYFDLQAQQPTGNYIFISPTDTEKEIIVKAAHIVPSEQQLRWQQLELTAFLHFGINTFTNKEWGDGKDDISLFDPKELDADQWVSILKNAGFKQVIITAKHHDGFCLWPSKYTEHSIRNTPYKNGEGDIVKAVAEACKKYSIGFGIYLSPWDRNSSFYGDSLKYNDYFVHQLTELLTQYGKVDEVWLDGANGEGPNGKKQWYDFNRWYTLIRKLQPQCVIANMGPDARWVGTETGVGRETEWSVLPLTSASQGEIAAHSQKEIMTKPFITGSYKDQDRGSRPKILHAKGLIWYPAETDVSIRPGWFYHSAEDSKVKSVGKLMDIYFTSVGRNGVLLLNVPPDKRGLISSADQRALSDWKKMYDRTFRLNLAANAHFTTIDGKVISGLTDKKITTGFTAPAKDSFGTVNILLNTAATFDVISLQENIAKGQRVEKFILEAEGANGWLTVSEGTTIGYKRLLKLDKPITAKKLRLRILASRLNPMLAELGMYKLPLANNK